MLKLPTIPDNNIIEYQNIISFGQISALGRTFNSLIVGIPTNYVVCGTVLQLLTTFAGSSLSRLTCSLGAFVSNPVLSNPLFYAGTLECTQLVSATSYSLSGPPGNNLYLENSEVFAPATGLYFNSGHDVVAVFTATGTNLNNLTVGAVQVTVQIRPF